MACKKFNQHQQWYGKLTARKYARNLAKSSNVGEGNRKAESISKHENRSVCVQKKIVTRIEK